MSLFVDLRLTNLDSWRPYSSRLRQRLRRWEVLRVESLTSQKKASAFVYDRTLQKYLGFWGCDHTCHAYVRHYFSWILPLGGLHALVLFPSPMTPTLGKKQVGEGTAGGRDSSLINNSDTHESLPRPQKPNRSSRWWKSTDCVTKKP